MIPVYSFGLYFLKKYKMHFKREDYRVYLIPEAEWSPCHRIWLVTSNNPMLIMRKCADD